MTDFERRVSALEARRGGLQALVLPDDLKLAELSYLAVDVLEAVARVWPTEHAPPGLFAGVVAALERPAAERVMAISMALGRYWPEASADPLELVVALTSCGILPGPAGDHA